MEIVRRYTDALNRALEEPSAFGHYLEFLTPDFEYHPEGGPEDFRSYGRADLQRYAEEWTQGWEELLWEVEDAIDLDEGRVFVAYRLRGKGKRFGLPLDMQVFELFWIRDRRVVRIEEFQKREDAVEAAGLSE